ncbi:hypothetical protein AAY473_011120 [Plecturocebus cupreus]
MHQHSQKTPPPLKLDQSLDLLPRLECNGAISGSLQPPPPGFKVLLCHPVWSAVMQSGLAAASVCQLQPILPPRPPSLNQSSHLGLPASTNPPTSASQPQPILPPRPPSFNQSSHLGLLASTNPPTSASRRGGTTGMRHHAWLIFKFRVEIGSPYVACTGRKLLGSSSPPALVSQSAGVTGWLSIVKSIVKDILGSGHHEPQRLTVLELTRSKIEKGLTLSPKLKCSGVIIAHCSLELLGSIEMEFHHVGQAGLELLTSSDPPASASQSVEIRGYQFQIQLTTSIHLLQG